MNAAKPNTKVRQNISIEPKLRERMIRICKLEDRSMSGLIAIALRKYIIDYEKAHGLRPLE